MSSVVTCERGRIMRLACCGLTTRGGLFNEAQVVLVERNKSTSLEKNVLTIGTSART
jgi:hypothetical protein